MKKRILLFLVLILGFTTLVGCELENENENNETEIKKVTSAAQYNGVYENGEYTFHILPIDDTRLKYYITNASNDKMYGRLEYKDGIAIYEEFNEKVKVTLNNNKILVEAENMADFPEGTYKYIEECTVDDFYENVNGLNKYFDSKYAGIYTNGDYTIYVYQPISKYMEFYAKVNHSNTSCESEYTKGQDLECAIESTKYIVKLGDNEITYIVDSKDEKEKYEGKFTKTSKITKKEIIEIFDPFYFFYREESDS